VVKHANTKEASVRLTMLGEDAICIEVTDAGTGFDVYRLSRPDAHEHHGILRTRERIHALGGRFLVESAPARAPWCGSSFPRGRRRVRCTDRGRGLPPLRASRCGGLDRRGRAGPQR
jgi:glucose-6-phosphate-specific signal transduction histidine kinase